MAEPDPILLDDSNENVSIVIVEGEHDIYTLPTLRERLDQAFAGGGGVVVDLSKATFIDSSVLGAIIDSNRRATERSSGFAVYIGDRVAGGVKRVLDLTALASVMQVDEGLDTILESVRGHGKGGAMA